MVIHQHGAFAGLELLVGVEDLAVSFHRYETAYIEQLGLRHGNLLSWLRVFGSGEPMQYSVNCAGTVP